ncbi:hypothetical protein [Jeotgalibacillus sp. R-1-5s-1]|uniref:hypothetical protein n=1 Tax=Jeotgalibacillus sp. R-1-5s-1 TaxID=2555897 RepID=UPI00106C364F|nr:hypothetical protein [Jeotgalibacillus sp. R-1-5s-1]TFD96623.1 hypothetical protein E2491_10890 [Jeotgalibacillus sp. R-1-5s-1]
MMKTSFPVSFKDCVDVMRHFPALRIAYIFVMLSVPIVMLMNYMTISRPANLEIAESTAQLSDLNRESFIYLLVAGVLLTILAHSIMKGIEKILALRLLRNIQKRGASELLIGLDEERSSFVLGESQSRQPINGELRVISTPNKYIFFKGIGLQPLMFFLPKHGRAEHEETVRSMIEFVSKQENVTVKERKK